MKNTIKSKQLLSIFIDFAFMVIIATVIILFTICIKFLLYGETRESQTYTIITENMPKDFIGDLHENDLLFDPISKRGLGKIEKLQVIEKKDSVRFIISFTSYSKPKSNKLRTKNLWFEYSVKEGENRVPEIKKISERD